MNNSNFFIQNDKIYNIDKTELLPDENGVVKIILKGYERRFKADRLLNFLELNNYIDLIKKPLKVRIKKVIKVIKVIEKKPQRKCTCGVIISGKIQCRKCFLESRPRKGYIKVTFDKRCDNGKNGLPKRPIICSNGKTYESMTKASQDLNVTKATIWNICNKKWKTTKGLTFNYL